MRRIILTIFVLLGGMASLFIYSGIKQEQEFQQLMTEGDQALKNNETLLAIESYSGALALKPDSMVVFLKRGETYQRHGDLTTATRDLLMAEQLDPTETRAHELLGDVSYDLQYYDDAIEHYSKYVQLDDGNPRVLYKLALAHERTGRFQEAIPLLRLAIELDSQFPEAHYLLGLFLLEQDSLEEASASLRYAVELSPGFLKAREALAFAHRTVGDRREEFRQLDALAALDQNRPLRYVTRALALARAGQTQLAILALGRAAEEHPDQLEIYSAIGKVWLEIAETNNDNGALIKALEALLLLPTTNASSLDLTLLGRAHHLNGDTESAKISFRQATERFPLEIQAFIHLAELEEQDNNWQEGNRLRSLHQVLTINPREHSLKSKLYQSTENSH
jgi:tetratricopeptide (TPR) repeat protein